MVRPEFLFKHGKNTESVMLGIMRTIMTVYNIRSVDDWPIYYKDIDRMLTRINYERSNESNTIKSDGKRISRSQTTD